MNHRYIVWEGRYRGRRFEEMHIIGPSDKPICKTPASQYNEHEAIYNGRPARYALCRLCIKKRAEFEQAEKLRTWQDLDHRRTSAAGDK